MKITFRALPMGEIVEFALQTLREKSPVASGLYRDSHMAFVNGRVVSGDLQWKPGDTIHISNPVPYSRKIEAGRMRMSVPPHVYEQSQQVVAGRFGNQVAVRFVFMPVRFGDMQAWAKFSRQSRTGRRMSAKARRDWLVRQPALQITARG